MARPRQRRLKLRFHHRLNEFADAVAHTHFDRIKSAVEKLHRRFGRRLRRNRLRDIAPHGGVSCPAPPTRVI
jgi:hypothetical protein